MSAQTTPADNSAPGVTPAAPWRITAISVLPDYRLAGTFQDGLSGVVDCSGILSATEPGIFAPLAAPEFFAQAALQLGAVTWPNGADLDPLWMHEGVRQEKTWTVPF